MSAPSNPVERAHGPRRVAFGVLLGIVVSVLGLATGASPVSAHTAFVGSTPSDGSVVTEPVDEIVIEFTGVSEEAGDGFVVLDATGQTREPSSVTTDDGKVFTLRFDPALSGGRIGVRWSVRAGDAHPIDGSFAFTVDEAAAAAVAGTPSSATAAGDMSSMTPEEMAAMSSDGAASSDMSSMTPEEMAAMDDFLEVDESRPGESLARLGRLISFAAIVLGIGALAFAATTLRGRQSEIETLITSIRVVGAAIVVGAAAEYVGVARIAGDSLSSAWSSSTGSAPALRAVAGLAIAFGIVATTVVVRSPRSPRSLSSAVNTTHPSDVDFWGDLLPQEQHAPTPGSKPDVDPRQPTNGGFIDPGLELARRLSNDGSSVARESVAHRHVPSPSNEIVHRTTRGPAFERRPSRHDTAHGSDVSMEAGVEREVVRQWQPDRSSWLAFVGVGLAIASFWFDGHTVTKGFRPLHAVANSVHVVAGSVWVGGVVTMAAVLWLRHRRGQPSDALGLVVRFSAVASVALGAVVIAGLVMAVSILDSVGELTSTQWGQTLLLKSAAAGVAIAAGAYNHFRLMPALERNPNDESLHQSVRATVTAEAIMLTFVVVVTAWLVAAAS